MIKEKGLKIRPLLKLSKIVIINIFYYLEERGPKEYSLGLY